ncbi:MAG: uroporphyrinogen decarboxylase [Alphaproteobacteria bacterium]|nr:uroporphyrinogen decarboxylase [Alphaproteobacteria bacterium]
MKPLLDVLHNRDPHRRPIWLMRQAGRYLPEYRVVRQRAGSFLNLCYCPELACEVTLQPLRRFDLDAAILFSDILVVPQAMGLSLDFKDGEGPVLETVDSLEDVKRLRVSVDGSELPRVWETVGLLKSNLPRHVTLIGFCGAPWTVASYMIEGGSSDRRRALAVAEANPEWFTLLLDKVTQLSIAYLLGQIKAGAETIQIFDSWAGDIPAHLQERLVSVPIAKIVAGVRTVYPGFPVIVFARGVGNCHGAIALATGANAVGVEENASLRDVLAGLAGNLAVQGNLAPGVLLRSADGLESAVRDVLVGVPRARHIFNLGHGVVPQTDPSMVERLVREVRKFDEAVLC